MIMTSLHELGKKQPEMVLSAIKGYLIKHQKVFIMIMILKLNDIVYVSQSLIKLAGNRELSSPQRRQLKLQISYFFYNCLKKRRCHVIMLCVTAHMRIETLYDLSTRLVIAFRTRYFDRQRNASITNIKRGSIVTHTHFIWRPLTELASTLVQNVAIVSSTQTFVSLIINDNP